MENKLDTILLSELQGAALRAKIQWFEESEKSTKLFLNLEKSRQKKVIKQLFKCDGMIVNDLQGVMQAQVDFYRDLYKSEPTDVACKIVIIDNISNTLSNSDMIDCDKDLTAKDLFDALSSMKTNKRPGNDGLTPEFFKHFWGDICSIFMRLTGEIYNAGELTINENLVDYPYPKEGRPRKPCKLASNKSAEC